VKLEPVPGALSLIVESNFEVVVASLIRNKRKRNLLLNELEASIKLILAPPSDPAPDPSPIVEHIVKLVVTGWKTRGVHIGLTEVNVSVSVEESDVIAESASAELRVFENPDNGVLLVILLLRLIETTGVPLPNSNLQQIILLKSLELVSSSDHLPGWSPVVIVGVIRDDGAAADEVIVLVEEEAGPGKLSRQRISEVTSRIGRQNRLSGAAHLVTAWCIVSTSLGPWDKLISRLRIDAGDAKH